MNLSQLRRSLAACLLLASGVAWAAPGDFDPSFNRLGFTREAVADSSTVASCVAIHPSGEIVTSGHYGDFGSARLVLWRYLPDGTLDATFGGTGIVYPSSPTDVVAADSLAIDQLDRIVLIATTSTSYVVHRFNFDGSADVSFSGTGSVTIPAGTAPYPVTAIAIYPDNKILGVGGALGAPSRFIIYRLQETGELDSSFGGTGLVFTEISPGFGADRATGVLLQADSKIVVAGRARTLPSLYYDVALARYLPSGQLDPEFGTDGKVRFSFLDTNLTRKVTVQPDGKLVVAVSACVDLGGGAVYCNPGLARVDDRGALDPTFGDRGRTYVDVGGVGAYAYDLALQPDNAIVTAGYRILATDLSANALLVRFQPDGSLDQTFGLNGISETNYGYMYNVAGNIRLQADGRMVVSGYTSRGDSNYRSVTARYLAK